MNNRSPQITFIFDRRKIATPTVKSSVELRISYNYSQKYLSTGIKLYSTQWKNGKIVNCPDIIQISQMLDKLLSDVRKIIIDMMNEGNVNIQAIPERMKRMEVKKPDFLQFCTHRAVIRKYGKEKDTQERYDRFLKFFSIWGKIKSYEDVTDENIIEYDKYLLKCGMKPYSKWNNYHRFLSGFIQDAIDEGLLRRNPYKWINIEKKKESLGLDKCLTPKEFKKLRCAKMPTESLEKVRDLFVFQTYTCLRYSDLRRFDSKQVVIVNGTKVYRCTQKKTKKPATIPLLQPALDVLHKYGGQLPVISNVKYNAYLKVVAQAAKLDYKLSTHWARHTGATMLLNEGIDMKIVTKVCGHSSTRITEQIYAKLLDETVVNAVQEVKDSLE